MTFCPVCHENSSQFSPSSWYAYSSLSSLPLFRNSGVSSYLLNSLGRAAKRHCTKGSFLLPRISLAES